MIGKKPPNGNTNCSNLHSFHGDLIAAIITGQGDRGVTDHDLARATGWPPTTVLTVTASLAANGVIEADPSTTSTWRARR